MKKNVMMRLASGLLVAVLLTTCAISGTFAKYVSTGFAEDNARVAKWGVAISASGQLFGDTYKAVGAGNSIVAWSDAHAGTVNSGTENDNVVAPGTKNEDGLTVAVTGTPEVAVRVNYVGTVTLSGWAVPGKDFYCPIIVTIKDDAGAVKATIDGATYATAAEFKAAIETYINNFSQDYDPNTLIDNQANATLNISWAWPFYVSDTNDVYDTALGDAATPSTIAIRVDCTATQID